MRMITKCYQFILSALHIYEYRSVNCLITLSNECDKCDYNLLSEILCNVVMLVTINNYFKACDG